jgi:Ca-activated chloride channel family protein
MIGRGALALCLVLLSAACTAGGPEAVTLRVLAGPDLADMQPILDAMRHDTGVRLEMDYRATADALEPGNYQHDLAWLTSDAFFKLKVRAARYPGRLPLATKIMSSPVAIGIKPQAAARLRSATPGRALNWADVADAAAAGTIRFGMADPRQAGSGLSALVGVATAAAGAGRALGPQDVSCDRLGGFFSGQSLTATTTADLASRYVAEQDTTDALVAYESTVLSLNSSGLLRTPLEVLYPADGLVLAEFPLLLLDAGDRAAYDKVVAWLLSPDGQRKIMSRTLRRPLSPDVTRDQRLRADVGNALYFPDQQAVIDKLLADYGRAPTHVIFVLDWSGSMRGERMARLRATFAGLSGSDRSSSGKFVRFHQGEKVTLMKFGGTMLASRTLTLASRTLDPPGKSDISSFLASGALDGHTAVWSALLRAYQAAGAGPASIVLMTDGENNAGIGLDDFLARYRSLPPGARGVHTYTIGLGEADPAELDRAARATGGRTIEATAASLQDAFKEVRGCG